VLHYALLSIQYIAYCIKISHKNEHIIFTIFQSKRKTLRNITITSLQLYVSLYNKTVIIYKVKKNNLCGYHRRIKVYIIMLKLFFLRKI